MRRTWNWSVLRKSASALSHILDAFSAANRRFTLSGSALEALIEHACLTGRLAGLGAERRLSSAQLYPLSLWPWQDVIKAVFLDRVDVVSTYDQVVHSPSFEMKLPSVVSLKHYVAQDRPPAFTRFNLFLRDASPASPLRRLRGPHLRPRDPPLRAAAPPGRTLSLPAHRAICGRAT